MKLPALILLAALFAASFAVANEYAEQLNEAIADLRERAASGEEIDIAALEQRKAEAMAEIAERARETCRETPEKCSCEGIEEPEAKAECEAALQEGLAEMESEKEKALQLKESIMAKCRENIDECSCGEITDEKGKEECEAAIEKAKYEAKEQRDKAISSCVSNLDACDCSAVENSQGKAECNAEKEKAIGLKSKIEAACKADPSLCSCSEIDNDEGRKECENKRKEAIKMAEGEVLAALNKCFNDVDACDCNNLGLQKQEYIDFCEAEKNYGISCRDKGLYCDELEEMELTPPSLPSFLQPIFKKTYKELIEKEKEKGAKAGAKIMEQCILNPSECDCSLTPEYAQGFCEQKKQLQLKCLADNYDACMELDATPDLPEGMPKFSVGLFSKIASAAKKIQKGIVQSRAASKVGDAIMACMDSADSCDCSVAPEGKWRAFCEHKKELIGQCRGEKNYDACFTLDEEPVITEDVPDVIKNYVNKNIVPKVEEKKALIYNEMKAGTVCENVATLKECREVYYGKA